MDGRRSLVLAAWIVLALAALVAIDAVRFADPDLFVTLYAGRDIAAHHGPPGVDTASFTVNGQPWRDYEWGARLVFYEIARISGDRGLVVLRLFLVGGALATLLAIAARAGAGTIAVAVSLGLLTVVAGSYMLFRPTLFTFLAVVLLLAALERLRAGARWPLWAIPLAMPLWANLHAGFALGVVLLGTLVACAVVERLAPPAWAPFAPGVPLGRAAWCLASGAALATLHPLGPRVWGAVFGTLRGEFTPAISEWWPITAYPFEDKWPAYLMMLLVAAMIVLGRRRIALFDAAATVLLGASAFLHVRFLPLFALVGAVVLLRTLPALGLRLTLPRQSFVTLAIAVAVLGATVWKLGTFDLRIRKVPWMTPVPAVAFLRDNGFTGPVLTEYDWGGYVHWKIPEATIFVDGRSDTVYPLAVIQDWGSFVNDIPSGRDVAERYGARVIALRRDQPVVPTLEHDPRWLPAFADPYSVVFVRDVPENAALVDALRSRRAVAPIVRPEDYLGL